jgi:hypothetical protein
MFRWFYLKVVALAVAYAVALNLLVPLLAALLPLRSPPPRHWPSSVRPTKAAPHQAAIARANTRRYVRSGRPV